MAEEIDSEVIELQDLDLEAWNEYAEEQGWGDGMPLVPPTEERVARMMAACRGDNEPFAPISPARWCRPCRAWRRMR